MEQEANNNQRSGSCAKEAHALIRRLNQGDAIYYDVDQYENFIDYFIQKNELSNSLRIVEFANRQHDGAIPLWIKKSQIIFNLGQIDEAISLAKHCMKFEPSNAELYYLVGTGYLNKNDGERAKKYFDHTFHCESEHLDEILFNIGYAYEQVLDYHNAIEFFRGAIRNNPKNTNAIYDLAYSYDKIGNYKKAIWAYNHYLELDPYNTSVWFNLGIALNHTNNQDKALEAYEYTLAINDKHTAALFNKANILANQYLYDEAIKAYNEYLELDPESDEAYCYIADCYFNKREYGEALNSYKQAIKINGTNDSAWYGGALILLLTEDYDQCMSFLKQTVKINADISDYWISIGKVSLILNQYEEAEYAFEKAISLSPEESEVWTEMASFYHHYDQTAMAVDTLNRSKAFLSNDVEILYALSAYAYLDHQLNTGYQSLKKALSIDSDSAETLLFEAFPELEKITEVKDLLHKQKTTVKLP
ncbi:tetratricopeptide repeat protein [Prolixibacteraceae bacterium]|nr:tetratricopeptide repeat protein [Prolixibacteraceae bacterium]